MNIAALIEAYSQDSDANKHSVQVLLRFFENKTENVWHDLSQQDFVTMFSASAIMNKSTFAVYKSIVYDFLKWLHGKGVCTRESLDNLYSVAFYDVNRVPFYKKYYFRDYAHLLKTMQDAVSGSGSSFQSFQAAATLIWAGIESKYLPEILKTDVSDSGIVLNTGADEKIQLPSEGISLVLEYRDAEDFDTCVFGSIPRKMKYKKSQYLFRTNKSASMTTDKIAMLPISVNRSSFVNYTGKVFQWARISLSGLFYRVHLYEEENGLLKRSDFAALKKAFHMEDLDTDNTVRRQFLRRKYDEYTEFREIYYG